jgi:hypothetical protein
VGTEVDCSEMIILREIRGKCVSNMSMWVAIGGIELATSLLMPQLTCWVMTIGAMPCKLEPLFFRNFCIKY